MMAHKHFECPHCDGQVPATRDDLEAAAVALTCPACGRTVYLAMGKLAQHQPEREDGPYDSGG